MNIEFQYKQKSWELSLIVIKYRIKLLDLLNFVIFAANGTVEDVHIVFEFVFFQAKKPDDWQMNIYQYFRCGSTGSISLPELPQAFQTAVEFTNVVTIPFILSIYIYIYIS
jgi:hypothetical protein